jgi:pyridoxamine 5'-phosphate oxidase-like protein
MITWTDFHRQQPALADAGRRQFYQFGIGLAFLATVRPDGAPRVHPVCPVIGDAGLHLLIVTGPKQQDLRRDGRYALHSEMCPPPRQDDGFALAGRAREVTDAALRQVIRAQVLAERDGTVWPSFDEDVIFELVMERALLTLTQADGPFPAGPTIWREGNRPGG